MDQDDHEGSSDPTPDDDDDDDAQHIYPAAILERENRKNNFFKTVMLDGPGFSSSRSASVAAAGGGALKQPPSSPSTMQQQHHQQHHRDQHHNQDQHHSHARAPKDAPSSTSSATPLTSLAPPAVHRPLRIPPRCAVILPPVQDPVQAGIVTSQEVATIFDNIFHHLNPFINLFNPQLHTPTYVRDRCPFLYTIMIMAGCKFWMQDRFRAVQRLVEEFSVRAFLESWKRIEVVQAYMCMTYWKEPDDTRTWTLIGYAARMAVELGLSTYTPMPSPTETEQQWLERRNRERTYLVLWVHDRSLSMQTGRDWMLPETDLIRNADSWFLPSRLLPIDVVVSAQVSLRRTAAEVTDMFYLRRGGRPPADVNYDVLLRCANYRLQTWIDDWMGTLTRYHGSDFHKAFLNFFQLHVRLFLNSIGLFSPQASNSAVTVCYTSAVETLQLVATEFTKLDILRYGQDSVSVMTAYSAVSLLKLLRNWPELNEITSVYDIINSTAQAYESAAKSMIATSSHPVEYHGRFLRSLVVKDQSTRAREKKRKPTSSQHSGGGISGGPTFLGGSGSGSTRAYRSLGQSILASQVCAPETLVINDVGCVRRLHVPKGTLPVDAGAMGGASPPEEYVKMQAVVVSPPLAMQRPQDAPPPVVPSQSQQQSRGEHKEHARERERDREREARTSAGIAVNGVQNGTHAQHPHQSHSHSSQHPGQGQFQLVTGPGVSGAPYQQQPSSSYSVRHASSGSASGSISNLHHGQTGSSSQQQPLILALQHPHPHSHPHSAHLLQQQQQQHLVQQQQVQQAQTQTQTPGPAIVPYEWGFPASPVLPSHPLVSPENEIPPMSLQGPGSGAGSGGGGSGTSNGANANAVAGPGPSSLAAQQQQQANSTGGVGGGVVTVGHYGAAATNGTAAGSGAMQIDSGDTSGGGGGGGGMENGMGSDTGGGGPSVGDGNPSGITAVAATDVAGGGGTAPSGVADQNTDYQRMEVAYWYAMHGELGYGDGTLPFMPMPIGATQSSSIGPQHPQQHQQAYRTMDLTYPYFAHSGGGGNVMTGYPHASTQHQAQPQHQSQPPHSAPPQQGSRGHLPPPPRHSISYSGHMGQVTNG